MKLLRLSLLIVLALSAGCGGGREGVGVTPSPAPVGQEPDKKTPVPEPPQAAPLAPSLSVEDPALVHNERGLRHLEDGRLDEGIEELLLALGHRPDDATLKKNLSGAHLLAGVAALENEAPEQALEHLRESLALDPLSASAVYHTGIALQDLDRWQDAVDAFEKAVELDSTIVAALDALAACKEIDGKIERAVELLTRAQELEPTDDRAHRLDRLQRDLSVGTDFAQEGGARFELRFDAEREDPAIVADLKNALGDAITSVGTELGAPPGRRLQVVLYDGDEFAHVTGSHRWVGGLYDGRIHLQSKEILRGGKTLQGLVRHEVAHALLHERCPSAPAWVQEGVAQLLEGRDLREARRVVDKASDGLLALLSGGSFTSIEDPLQAQRAYALSLLLMNEIAERASLRHFVSVLHEERDPGRAVERVLGMDLERLVTEVLREAR